MVEYHSDLGTKTLWYQGNTLTILDPSHDAYSTVSVPGSIDGMLEQMSTSQGLTIPLSDLAFSDPLPETPQGDHFRRLHRDQ